MAERERRADIASLRHVLAPESVVVIGASRRQGTVGRAILDNIRTGGYAGRLYVVNPRARQISGEHCLSSVLDLPEAGRPGGDRGAGRGSPGRGGAVRPAWRAVPGGDHLRTGGRRLRRPARGVPQARHAAGRPGLLRRGRSCHRPGRHVCRPAPAPGVAGLVMQSGGLGFALADQLSQLGIGISSFASVGSKLDVSSNDMLMWWENNGVTKLALLYIESFGNPRKFARTARRVGAHHARPGCPSRALRGRPARGVF